MLQTPLRLNINQAHLTDEQFNLICQNNPELSFEKTSQGALIIMSPVGGDSGNRESELIGDLVLWNRQTKLGFTFSSSTIFKLPNGANRSPDVAWIEKSRWLNLTPMDRMKFPPIAPDFVIELRSQSDDLLSLQNKMKEYISVGVKLGWLINPQDQQVEIYRVVKEPEIVNLPVQLSGENVLPGLILDLPMY
ncbi:MAG TPA: Uma2 family endonuclease [Allocoleopsis sp.]